jgi:hypothetical protein
MAEQSCGLAELLDVQRLFKHCHRTYLQNSVEHLAVCTFGNRDDVEIGIHILRRFIEFVSRLIRQVQVQKRQVEFLFAQTADRLLGRPDNDAAKPDLL